VHSEGITYSGINRVSATGTAIARVEAAMMPSKSQCFGKSWQLNWSALQNGKAGDGARGVMETTTYSRSLIMVGKSNAIR
jgi:hypothetical protein